MTVALGIIFLVLKLIARHQSHKLASISYDLWPVLAWFGVDLGFLGIGLAISRDVSKFLDHEEAIIFYVGLVVFVLSSWMCYGHFMKRYQWIRDLGVGEVWSDFRACTFIMIGLFFGFFGFIIVVRGIAP